MEQSRAGAGSEWRQRVQRAESAPAAFWPWRLGDSGPRDHYLAVRTAADDRASRHRHTSSCHGGAVSREISAVPAATIAAPSRRRFLTVDNRFLPPILITCILLAAHLSFGVLESYPHTALAIVTAIATE